MEFQSEIVVKVEEKIATQNEMEKRIEEKQNEISLLIAKMIKLNRPLKQ